MNLVMFKSKMAFESTREGISGHENFKFTRGPKNAIFEKLGK